jgi:hypothetical protein
VLDRPKGTFSVEEFDVRTPDANGLLASAKNSAASAPPMPTATTSLKQSPNMRASLYRTRDPSVRLGMTVILGLELLKQDRHRERSPQAESRDLRFEAEDGGQ